MTPPRPAEAEPGLTEDRFLDGRLSLLQPIEGYRAGLDAVLLAAACPAERRDRVLDVGSGVGVAALCLATRVKGVDLEGFELQETLAALSRRNALRSGIAWLAHVGDICAPPLSVRATSYDHVISNPPYYEAGAGGASPNAMKDSANRETVPLEIWLDFCLRRLRSKGWITVIHRAERAPAILAALSGRAGSIAMLPIAPRPDAPAKRVIVRAMKDSARPFRLAAAFTLHEREGDALSERAAAVLRDGAPLDF